MSKIYKGIDISYYQGTPDFKKIKAAGIDFVIHKAGQGRTADYNAPFTDRKFETNVKAACLGNGFYQGSYWYFCARTEAEVKQEAEYYINIMKKYRFNLQLWAAVDVEDAMLPKDKKTLTKFVKMFCDMIKAAGYRPMVYTSSWWVGNRFDVPAGVPLWEANWSINSIPERARMWQLGTTVVDGVGEVDTNLAKDIIGDANGDGKVNLKDVAAMMKYIAGWKNVKIDESQADINQDGYVTSKDVSALTKLLSK